MNNRQVAHVWAQQRKESGKGSHFYFDGATIYSYGPHFPIAAFSKDAHGKPCVLFTYRNYSRSTSTHINFAKQALYGLGIEMHYVENPHYGATLQDAGYHKSQAIHWALKAKNARTNKEYFQRLANSSQARFFDFCKAFKIKHPDARKATIFNEKEIEVLNAKQKEERTEIRKREKKREENRLKEIAENRAAWLRGENVYLNYNYGDAVLLRIKGNEVQTSRGASVPLEEARNLYSLAKQHGVSYVLASRRVSIGEFTIDAFRDGNIIAGCHTIPYTEIERIFA